MTSPNDTSPTVKTDVDLVARAMPLPIGMQNMFGDYDTLLHVAVRRKDDISRKSESSVWVACSLTREGIRPSLVTERFVDGVARTVLVRLSTDFYGTEVLILSENFNTSAFEDSAQ